MAKQFFKDLPDTSTPLNASRLNGLLDGEEAMGNLVVDSIRSKNRFDGVLKNGAYNSTTGEYITSDALCTNKLAIQSSASYYLSGITGSVRIHYWNNNTYVGNELVSAPNTFTSQGNIIAFQFANNTPYTNIQLEQGISATAYSPYQELDINNLKNKELVVGSIRSKNMFDMNKLVLHNCAFTSNNNSFTLTGANGYGSYDTSLKGGTYTISGNITGDIDYIDIYINGNFNRHTLPYTFTLSSTSTLGLVLYSSNTYTDFQLEKGSSKTTYYPFQNLDNQEIYSTGEIKIGTWIDGKPLYRKVITGATTDGDKDIDLTNLNIYEITNVSGLCGNEKPVNFYFAGYSISTRFSGGHLYLFASTPYANLNYQIILEYTKTTD